MGDANERQNKKRKYAKFNHRVKQKSIEPGLQGVLFSCDGREHQALKEAYNLIDELLEKHPELRISVEETGTSNEAGEDKGNEVAEKSENNEESSEEEDVADKLMRVCEEAHKSNDKKKDATKVIRQRPTGVKNMIFVNLPNVKICEFCWTLVDYVQSTPKCRYLQRLYPVEITRNVNNLDRVSDGLAKIIARHLRPREDGSLPTYGLEFKVRFCEGFSKQTVIDMLDQIVRFVAPIAKCNLKNPDVTFLVQVLKTSVLIGTAFDFQKRAKYSMLPQKKDEKEKTADSDSIQKAEVDGRN